jgi:hypothetical protein
MKIYRIPSVLSVLREGVEGLLDIFESGATAMEDCGPETDARNLRYDLQQIGGDFRRVMAEIESGTLK